ncbi:MAG: 2-keto-3-deoxy-L-rhamnonate aldolase RhmA [Verrucomicrobiales bacterium]|jgi:2-keto-3-deoxy-L-rhamnonate aldolase RhmA
MIAAKILREKIASEDRITTGMLCTFHFWPGMVEMAMKADFDYLIIDLEHITFDAAMVAEACAIGRREDFPILIRPPAAEYTPVRLALDLGPCGLLIPMVETSETMKVIQDAVYMKPRGRRRPGGPGNHWVSDVNYETWKAEVEDDLIILPQIESRVGLENVAEIAEHPLTTAIAVGPYDLSADLGVCYDPGAEVHREALHRIRDAGRAAGKAMWMIGDGPKLAEDGYRFLCIAEPTMFLQSKLKELNLATRGESAAESSTASELPLP